MRIICLSDTHCGLNRTLVPKGDLLIHAGDLTFKGTVAEIAKELAELKIIRKNFKHGIVLVPGNHDWLFERDAILAKKMCEDAGVTLLIDEAITIDGYKFYGSPWQPEFCSWAFNLPRGQTIKAKWDLIPDDTDVLITHGPALGILDLTPHGDKVGCADLFQRVLEVRPQLHVFGHIHQSHGQVNFNGTTFVNAAICDEQYRHTNDPIVIDLE